MTRRCRLTCVTVVALLAGCSGVDATSDARTSPPPAADTTAHTSTSAQPTSDGSRPSAASPVATSVARTLPATTLPATTPASIVASAAPVPTSATSAAPSAPAATGPGAAPHRAPDRGDDFPFVAATVDGLTDRNLAGSVTVRRDGEQVYGAAFGATNGGGPVVAGTPFVLASVSKLVTALSVARLVATGRVDVAAPVPWGEMGIWHDPAWETVTVRELLDHTSGMPVARGSWLDDPGSCAIPLVDALARPPRDHRGEWRYSNGNYCALGLLVAHVTGVAIDRAAEELIFRPVGIRSAHLTTDGEGAADAPYTNGARGVERLERLGGAGTWMMASADVARMLDEITDTDLGILAYPGIMRDQYGWGHSGTVDGAKACAWVMEGGRTIVVGAVSGNDPGSGAELCTQLESAVAVDLGFFVGEPFRTPR